MPELQVYYFSALGSDELTKCYNIKYVCLKYFIQNIDNLNNIEVQKDVKIYALYRYNI